MMIKEHTSKAIKKERKEEKRETEKREREGMYKWELKH
jgi:hypothetical protein